MVSFVFASCGPPLCLGRFSSDMQERLDRDAVVKHDTHRSSTWLLPAFSLFRSSVAERLNDGEQWLEAGEYTNYNRVSFSYLPGSRHPRHCSKPRATLSSPYSILTNQ